MSVLREDIGKGFEMLREFIAAVAWLLVHDASW
jgi:hypothetical protein